MSVRAARNHDGGEVAIPIKDLLVAIKDAKHFETMLSRLAASTEQAEAAEARAKEAARGLDERAVELDAREAAIAKREAAVRDGEGTIKAFKASLGEIA